MNVSPKNLRAGLQVWRNKNWERDLGDALYARQAQLLADGASKEWWEATVPTLAAWLATRPRSKAEIHERGLKTLPRLDAAYRRLRPLSGFDTLEWSALQDLFEIAWSIKDVNSPVFASKLSHFMRPDLYMVVDTEVVGITGPYAAYWKACSAGWRRAQPLHAELKQILVIEIGSHLRPTFPFATKITELCVIGARA